MRTVRLSSTSRRAIAAIRLTVAKVLSLMKRVATNFPSRQVDDPEPDYLEGHASMSLAERFFIAARERRLISSLYRRVLGRPPVNPLYGKYRAYTMVPERLFTAELDLVRTITAPGIIVECGVWRGGMSAAMADTLPARTHYLFDSFEGLPPVKPIDGPAAAAWQADTLDNCRAERSFAEQAMQMSAARAFHLVAGWFCDTLPTFACPEPIAVLRLDCDWYDSMKPCLEALMPHLAPGGLVIIDDYHLWDGCSRAVHDYLSGTSSTLRIKTCPTGATYLEKATNPA
jgi:O-methyltransferase